MGESWYRQEYCCSFEALEGLVYTDFAQCVVQANPPNGGRWVGGMDFGLRNPFAAIWGILDRDDVLWIFGEHYSRERTLAHHVQRLPKGVLWHGDPQGAREMVELRSAGVLVRKGENDVPTGIQAVRSRLETGRLKILSGTCPNLLWEAGLYRYDPDEASERPIKENDHALDALRYLISSIDKRRLGFFCKKLGPLPPEPPPAAPVQPSAVPAPPAKPKQNKWLSIYNERLWTRLS
jgi:hypothetical protein